jgi:hypothetical protein
MEIQSLPQYRGLPDSLKGWGEPDEQGNMPTMRLRDYVILSLIISIWFPINLCLVVRCWVYHGNPEVMNFVREEQMEQERRRKEGLGDADGNVRAAFQDAIRRIEKAEADNEDEAKRRRSILEDLNELKKATGKK